MSKYSKDRGRKTERTRDESYIVVRPLSFNLKSLKKYLEIYLTSHESYVAFNAL